MYLLVIFAVCLSLSTAVPMIQVFSPGVTRFIGPSASPKPRDKLPTSPEKSLGPGAEWDPADVPDQSHYSAFAKARVGNWVEQHKAEKGFVDELLRIADHVLERLKNVKEYSGDNERKELAAKLVGLLSHTWRLQELRRSGKSTQEAANTMKPILAEFWLKFFLEQQQTPKVLDNLVKEASYARRRTNKHGENALKELIGLADNGHWPEPELRRLEQEMEERPVRNRPEELSPNEIAACKKLLEKMLSTEYDRAGFGHSWARLRETRSLWATPTEEDYKVVAPAYEVMAEIYKIHWLLYPLTKG